MVRSALIRPRLHDSLQNLTPLGCLRPQDRATGDMETDPSAPPADGQEQVGQQMYELAQKLHLVPDWEPSRPLLKQLNQAGYQFSRAIAVPYWRDISLPKWPVLCLSLAGFCSGVGLAALAGLFSLSSTGPGCQATGAGCSAQAIAQLPNFEPLTGAERDGFWSRQAKAWKSTQFPIQPLYQALAELWVIRAQLRQPATMSPLETQGWVNHLEQQIQDLTQLQLAQMLAGLYQVPTIQAAIQLAQAIPPDRPYYAYAQTLIPAWQQTKQQAEDRPYLKTAQQLALDGKVEGLKAAIVEAQQVFPGRASRGEAQALIFRWTRQVQTLEDQPILEQARTLARQNKLEDAVRVASQIPPGRVLSATAQALVDEWSNQLYLASDQAVLDQATALADQLYLTRAIELAAQISPERPLYPAARAAIADWEQRRAEFWRLHAAEAGEPSDFTASSW